MLETVADEVEQFLLEVVKGVTETVDALADFSEEVAEQWQNATADEFNHQTDAWLDSVLEAVLGLEAVMGEVAEPMLHTVEPILNQHPACVGCHHYHGQSYGGVPLVCAMHPYGWDAENCPDWESTWMDGNQN